MNEAERQRKFNEIINRYSEINIDGDQSQLVECLREVQEIFGCIPKHLQEKIAKANGSQVAIIKTLIRTYPSLTDEYYDHEITICRGRECACRGSAMICNKIQEILGIEDGEISEDGRFKLRLVNCMHSCRTAPNVRIGSKEYHKVTPDQVQNILNQYE